MVAAATLDELALTLLRLGIGRWEIAQLRRLLCRLSLDERPAGVTMTSVTLQIAVPQEWTAVAERVDATGLSDHDAYLAEVTRR